MGATERAYYSIKCRCGAAGQGYWQENDGARYLSRGPETVVEVPSGFEWLERKVPDGAPGAFFGRKLICKSCRQIPKTEEEPRVA